MSIDLKVFLTKDSFSEKIEKRVLDEEISYFQAIIEFAEDCDKSPEEMLPFMSQVMLEKVRKSANDLGLIDIKSVTIDSLLG